MRRFLFLTLVFVLLASSFVWAQEVSGPVFVSDPVVPTLTPAIRDLPTFVPDPNLYNMEAKRRDDHGIIVPDIDMPPHSNPLAERQSRAPGPGASAFGTPFVNFAGVTSTSSPPDDTGDVGPNHYVQGDNGPGGSRVTIYTKTGTQQAQFLMETLGSAPCNSGYCDPIIQYDQLADRWMISEFDSSANVLCVYVSRTADPLGQWWAYSFDMTSQGGMQDYPKYGVWPDGYYIGVNNGGYIHVLDRVKMLAGIAATSQSFVITTLSGFSFQLTVPGTVEGVAPPVGAPGLFARPVDTEIHTGYTCTSEPCDVMDIWAVHVDWTTPASSTVTHLPAVKIEEYDHTLCGTGSTWNCMPQPGTAQMIDPIREPIHFPLQYRNWGAYETLVGAFVEDVDGTDHAAVHWFELRKVAGTWSSYQEGVLGGEAGVHRSVAGAAMDGSGNIAVGYTRTGTTAPYYPSIYYSGRLSTDPLGTMPYYDNLIFNATDSNTDDERWGDYAGIGVDPSNDCSFWFTTEYGGSGNTRVAAFKFDACGFAGSVALNKDTYACSGTLSITVSDASLIGNTTQNVEIWSTAETTHETVVCTATPAGSATFIGTITLSTAAPAHGDGLLSIANGNTITVQYIDADDGAGGVNVVRQDTAAVDCAGPVISNVLATSITDSSAIITWTTSELANSRVTYGLSTPPGTNQDDLTNYVTSHSVMISGLTGCTKYYFSVTSADVAGNSATDNNAGTYYSFTTAGRSFAMGPDNVEGTVLSWVASGTTGAIWHQDTCKSNSPTHAWKAGAVQGTCPGAYVNSATTDLTWSADINLGSAGHGYHLTWKEWYATESGYDWCLPQISVNGGGAWTDLATHYAGASGGWITKDIDLAAYTGSTVRIRFHFTTDGSATGEGWYVDDIEISKSQGCSADVKYQSHTRTDVCNGTGSGNNNGIWDPGEDSVITVTAVNSGMSAASNVVGTLTTSTPGITVTDNTATFPNMTANGGTGVSQPNHFSVRADSGITCGTVANFTLHTTCTENPAGSDSTFAMTVGQAGGTLTAFSEAFTGVTVPALPTGWTTLVTTGNAWVTNASGCTGNALMYPYNSSAAANSWAFSPAVTLTAGVTYTMAFNQKVYSASYPEAMEVKVGLGRTAATQTVLIYTATGLTNTACAARGGTFTVPTTGTYYFGFHCTSAADMWNLYVDDIAVTYTQAASCNVCTPTGCTAPGAPTLNSATGACTGVNLAWTAGTGTTNSYNVYRFTGACGGAYAKLAGMPVTGLTYSDTTAVAGTSYAYVVRGACDAGGVTESVNSNCLTATRTAVPAAPTGVSATAGCTGNSIAWTNAPTATSHTVLRGTTCGTAVTSFINVTTPYNDTTAVAGTAYQYWVVGINACGSGADSSCAGATRLAVPAAPAIPTFASITATTLTVNWTAVSGAATYDVWRAAGGACAGAVKLTGTPIAGTTYPDSGLTCNTAYSYYITANNTCGTSANGTCGPVTTAACGAVPPEVGPGTTPATSQGWTNKTTATWPSEATATSYTLYRGMKADLLNLCSSTTDSCTKYAGAGTSTATITEDPTGIAGGFYWYLVTGTNGSGEGTPGAGQCNPRVVNSTGVCP